MENLKEFEKLLKTAERGGSGQTMILKNIVTDVDESVGKLSETIFSEWIQLFNRKIIGEYEKEGISAVELNNSIRKLLEFSASLMPEEEVNTFDCKPPLGKLDTSFDEIAGQHQVKNDLLVNYIYPQTYPSLFTSKTKGILLYGSPGTGKSLLARAATAELTGVAFFAPTAGELRGKYEGETEKNIDKVFACAKAIVDDPKSPYKLAVLFMDEFDAVAGARGDDQSMRRSVNALLQAMDGIIKSPKVSVIAATNYPWDIDDAILRRLSSRVFVDLPDEDARVWLVESVLAENYSSPQIPQEERIKEFSQNVKKGEEPGIYGNIKYWGKRCYKSKKPVWWETGSILSKAYVEAICGKDVKNSSKVKVHLGPTEEGVRIHQSIQNGEYVNPEDYRGKDPMFGYSASDIVKLTNIAVQNSAFQALEGKFKETSTGDGRGGRGGGTFDFYVADPTGISIDEIPHSDRNKVMNYSICVYHIEHAYKSYPTTIRNDSYIKLLNYKYLGRVE